MPSDEEITARIRYEKCDRCQGRCQIWVCLVDATGYSIRCPDCDGFGQLLVRVDPLPTEIVMDAHQGEE
jgi:hypothetical protein